jgi:hypothetical protein
LHGELEPYLKAAWPDDIAIVTAIIEKADAVEADRRKDLANRIAHAISR